MNFLYGWNSISEFILDEYLEQGIPVEGIVLDDLYFKNIGSVPNIRFFRRSEICLSPNDRVVNCLGYRDLRRRNELGEFLLAAGVLTEFVSRHARVHDTASIGSGSILLGDVVLERHSTIGSHCLLWGGSRVCHDSVLGDSVFLASGSIVGGLCTIGSMSSVGFNSSTREKSTMPSGTRVGANRFWRPK
jgi:NDP-sugar pyrophosphorylase family protein